MSAAKMVADSTQSDLPEKSTRKRKKIVEKKKEKKKKMTAKKGKKKQAEEEYDENDLDLDNDILPISAYVKNRPAMVEELFHCVRGTSLQRALPDVLKEVPLEELKSRCLEQLEVMSKKRIRRIIAGDDPANISSSGTEDEESTEEEMEEEQADEEYLEDEEMQMADSTSQPAQEMEYSDREDGDLEEASDGVHSPTPSADGEQEAAEFAGGLNIHSSDATTRSIAQQNLELQRKLEEEHRSYKLSIQAYKARQQMKAEEEQTELQGEEILSGDISSQNEDSCDQPALAVGEDQSALIVEDGHMALTLEDGHMALTVEECHTVLTEEEGHMALTVEEGDMALTVKEGHTASTVEEAEKGEVVEKQVMKGETDSNLTDKSDSGDQTGDISHVGGDKEENSNAISIETSSTSDIKEEGSNSDIKGETVVNVVTEDKTEVAVTEEKALNGTEKASLEEFSSENKTDTVKQDIHVHVPERTENPLEEGNSSVLDIEKDKTDTVNEHTKTLSEHTLDTEADEIAEKSDNEKVAEEALDAEGNEESDSEGEEEEEEEEPEPQDVSKSLTQNQMELLELEMRARAIKAMLKMAK